MFRPVPLRHFQRLFPLVARRHGRVHQQVERCVQRKAVGHRLFFQHPADRPGHGVTPLHPLRLGIARRIRMDQHHDPWFGRVIKLFHHQAPPTDALLPGDGPHRVAAGVLAIACRQDGVFVEVAVHRDAAQKATHQAVQFRQVAFPGRNDELMEAPLRAGLRLQAQQVAADELQRLQYIAAPLPDADRDFERSLLLRTQPGRAPHSVPLPGAVSGQVVHAAWGEFPPQMEPQGCKGLPVGAAVPYGQPQVHRLVCLGKEVLRFQQPLQIVQTVGTGLLFQPEEQPRQHQRKYDRRHQWFSSGTSTSDSSFRSRWAAASAFMLPPRTTRWQSTAGASPLMSSGIT